MGLQETEGHIYPTDVCKAAENVWSTSGKRCNAMYSADLDRCGLPAGHGCREVPHILSSYAGAAASKGAVRYNSGRLSEPLGSFYK